MIILGLIDGQHDATACILKDGKLLAATAEERVTREKMMGGMPYTAIKDILKASNLKMKDIDMIAVGSKLTPPVYARIFRGIQKAERDVLMKEQHGLTNFLSNVIKYRLNLTVISPESILGLPQTLFLKWIFRKDLPKELKKKPLYFVNHHLSHASAAYFNSGQKRALVISADCWGDGLSMAVYACIDGNLKRVYTMKAMDSYGHFYASITKYLGFRPFRHEGKITGLAAYGDPGTVKIPFPFDEKKGRIRYTRKKGLDVDPKLKEELDEYRKEDIAAWLQHNMTKHIVKIAERWIKKTGLYNVVLVGGLFANVRFNQAIHEIPGVKFIYIFPEMGDGGLSVGAACYLYSQKNKDYINKAERLENMYLGIGYTDKEILEELRKWKSIKYKKIDHIEKDIARLIAGGKVVARFNGRMEFGPRALGNRSILYHAKDPEVNQWLNKRLKRTEFMPFAPSTIVEKKDMCYKKMDGADFAAKFMTITFDCTDFMKKNSPAAVHIDNTARPQLVNPTDNKSYYDIIKEYYAITGIPTIINTSFNMHEEPIVRSPNDAVRSFMDGRLDYLAIGNFLVERK